MTSSGKRLEFFSLTIIAGSDLDAIISAGFCNYHKLNKYLIQKNISMLPYRALGNFADYCTTM